MTGLNTLRRIYALPRLSQTSHIRTSGQSSGQFSLGCESASRWRREATLSE